MEEYDARDLFAYYHAISIGPSHNDYMGRAESDITQWIECFISGMALAFEKFVIQMTDLQNKGAKDQTALMRAV